MDFQNPFLRGLYGDRAASERSTANQIGTLGGLMQIQNQMRAQQEQGLLRQAVVMGPDGQVDARQTLGNIYKINPMLGMKLQKEFAKESQFSKVDPKDYTPESVSAFARTGNYADLVPVRKREAVNTGSSVEFVDPYTQTAPLAVGVSPNTRATLDQSQSQFNQRLPLEQARTGVDLARLQYDTGRGPMTPGANLVPPPMLPPGSIPQPGMVQPGSMQIPPAVQAERDATATMIRTAELQPDGGGMIPSSRVLPQRVQDQITAAKGNERAPAGYRFTARGDLEAIPGGPATAPTTAQKDELMGIRRTQDSATRLAAMFKPEFVGIGGTMGEFWDKYGTQAVPFAEGDADRIQFRALASDLENQYIKAISGATVPESEVPRLRRAIPNPNDSPTQYKAKLNQMITNLEGLPAIIGGKQTFVPQGTTTQGWGMRKLP